MRKPARGARVGVHAGGEVRRETFGRRGRAQDVGVGRDDAGDARASARGDEAMVRNWQTSSVRRI